MVNLRNVKWSWNILWDVLNWNFLYNLFLNSVSWWHAIVISCKQFFCFLKTAGFLKCNYSCWFAHPVSQSMLNKKLIRNPWQLQWKLKSFTTEIVKSENNICPVGQLAFVVTKWKLRFCLFLESFCVKKVIWTVCGLTGIIKIRWSEGEEVWESKIDSDTLYYLQLGSWWLCWYDRF